MLDLVPVLIQMLSTSDFETAKQSAAREMLRQLEVHRLNIELHEATGILPGFSVDDVLRANLDKLIEQVQPLAGGANESEAGKSKS